MLVSSRLLVPVGLFDQLLERQLQQQRKRNYGLPSNARDLGADF
jgi:hypothetical protein